MDIYRIFIILCIIIITTGIMYRLYHQRKEILGINGFSNIEGLDNQSSKPNSYAEKEFAQLKSQISWPSNISSSISPKLIGYPLKQYCIKAARNAACTGTYMNLDMITYCMQRGCRFLDFEVYCDASNNVVVSQSTDSAYSLDGKTTLPIKSVFDTILGGAFTGHISPNFSEPIFIQLHIKMDPESPKIQAFIQNVAKMIREKITSTGLQYSGKISFNTKFDQLMGKVVVLVNQNAVMDPNNKYSAILSNNADLGTVVNMMTGVYDTCPIIQFTSMAQLTKDVNVQKPALNSDSITTNIDRLREVILDPSVKANLDCYPVISETGIQILPYTFYYMSDYGTELQKYEGIFDNTKSGCIPLAYVLNHIKASQPKYGTTLGI